MMIYIMRHGLAEDPTPKSDDGVRKLTAKGAEKIRKAAAGMRAIGLAFEMILSSPIPRAMETAEIVANELGGSVKPRATPELTTGSSPAKALEAIAKLHLPEEVLIVGHEPTLSRLASLLLSGSSESVGIRLKQGGVIALEIPDRVEAGAADLRWMLTQRQMRQFRE
jgi:phosphohistidine phosphatase